MPNMRRAISHKLQAWSESSHRKPLVIFGARQVGKTYAIKQLASDRYDSLAYIDFSRDARAAALFDASLAPAELVPKLEVFLHTLIDPDRTLIVFDEVQLCERALTSLKYFCDDAPQYHVVAAGSLLGVALKRELYSFPVGKVDLLQLCPLSFEEFLWARGETRLADAIRDAYENAPDQAFALHDRAMQLVHEYELIGGMPEIVSAYVANDAPGIDAMESARNKQQEINVAYLADMAKYATPTETPRIMAVWNSIPQQLAKENHKFQYKLIKSGGRAAIYENAIAWLDAAGIIMRCTQVTEATAPLKTFENSSSFKIYTADVGLLSAQYEAIPQDLEPATDKGCARSLAQKQSGPLPGRFQSVDCMVSPSRDMSR
ncbi:ATP-binding protein [Bifidobacterium pullorum]|uniref:ATP-binding protein n=1 Tax=Bifidobacterium pullorum TaxID=78448 RepID=UPI0032094B72